MKKVVVGVCFFVTLVIIVVAGKALYPLFFGGMDTKGLTGIGPKVNVLIIDTPHRTPDELLEDMEEGRADLLLWVAEEQGEREAYAFNTLESLVRLEKNSLGFLDTDEPNLKGLNVARYDESKQVFYYMAAKAAGISAVEVSRDYLIGEVLSDPQNYKKAAGVVVFINGTKKELRMIKMPESQIEQAKLRLMNKVTGKNNDDDQNDSK